MDLLLSIFPAAVAYTIPLLMGALGGLYSERSGVTNLCIEGLMLMGCFACAASMNALQGVVPMNVNFIIGLGIAVIASSVFSLLHAFAAINLRADQTISGTAINLIATALTIYLAQTITGSGNITIAHSVVPFSISAFFSEAFYNILWAAFLLFVIWKLFTLIAKGTKLLSAIKEKISSVAIFWMTVCSIVITLILSFFTSSYLVIGIVSIALSLLVVFLINKGEKGKSNRFIARLMISNRLVPTSIVYAALFLLLILLSLSGVGMFLRRMVFNRIFWTTLVCIVIWAFSYFLLYKTSFGLRLRACGEHPSAVASAGVNVHRMRYIGVIASGALAGLGGAVYLITVGGEYNSAAGMNGLGFLAIAGLIFGQWKPFGILGSTFFFGFCYTIANMSRVVPALAVVPPGFLSAFPYVATLIVLVFTSKRNMAPAASGVPY